MRTVYITKNEQSERPAGVHIVISGAHGIIEYILAAVRMRPDEIIISQDVFHELVKAIAAKEGVEV